MTDRDEACRSTLWEQIDAVLVINLDGSTERWEKLMNHLEGVVPIEKIHRIAAVRGTELPGYLSHPWFTARTGDRARTCAGAAGCVLSHARALQYALEHEDWQVILVLEDDARLDVERLERMTPQFQDFMHDPRWELLYVGYRGEPLYAGKLGKQRDFFNIYRCSGVLGTFSMLLHRRVWRKILQKLPDHRHVWTWIAQYKAIDYWLQRWFTPFHEVFYVTPAPWHCAENMVSDISGNMPIKVEKAKAARVWSVSRWRKKHGFFLSLCRWIGMQGDRVIRWASCRSRGFSGGKNAEPIHGISNQCSKNDHEAG